MTKPEPLGPPDLQAYLDREGITGEIVFLDTPTPTVETAAQAVGCRPEQIVKSILFLVRDRPVMAVACGTQLVDRRRIAARYQVGRKRVKLADAATVLRLSGYAVGTVPPFGHREPFSILIDPGVLGHPVVYAGGGSGRALVRLNPQDILAHTGAEVLVLQSPPEK